MTDVVFCLDGLDPAYLDATETPNWDRIAAAGSAGVCEAAMPSLTNVNNLSIATASFPETHGITGNTYYDEDRGERVLMEDPEYRRCETVLEREAADGRTVAALVAKEKLERFVGEGLDLVAAAEDPPAFLEGAIGEAPGMYSGEISKWIVDAAVHVLDDLSPDVLYVSTTDVVPHKHAPDEERAKRWLRELDAGLGEFFERDCRIVATADHGMNAKDYSVDVKAVLEDEGYPAEVFGHGDKHTYHHQGLGGLEYVYLHEDDPEDIEWLASVEGVDEFLHAAEAVDRFHLAADRIGHAMVLAERDAAFGPVDAAPDLRAHGSLHERAVPYVSTEDVRLDHNKEAFEALL